MLNTSDHVLQHFYLYMPLLCLLWMLPWAAVAVWIDRGLPKQFSLTSLFMVMMICCLEMSAAFWFGLLVIIGGITVIGLFVFIPAMLVYIVRRTS